MKGLQWHSSGCRETRFRRQCQWERGVPSSPPVLSTFTECAPLTYRTVIDDEVFLYARSQACRRQLRFGARLTAHVIARMKAEGGHSLALESIW